MAFIHCKCGFKKDNIDNIHVGKKAKCPKCNNKVIVDIEQESLEFEEDDTPHSLEKSESAQVPPPLVNFKKNKAALASKISHSKYICPNCKSDRIQSFPMAYESGISSSISNSKGIGLGIGGDSLSIGFGGSINQSINMSVIAQKVAPPIKKTAPSWMCNSFLWWFFWPIIVILYFKNLRWNNEEYPKIYTEWENSWICYKCGNEFIL